MNEVFLIGEVITEIKFKFIVNSKIKNSIVKFSIEIENEEKISIVAYNEMADFIYKTLKQKDIIFINGKVDKNDIIVNQLFIL